jgi:nicotinamide phosphoribosyltransferase
MENNLLLMADSYKHSHYLQYPPKTETVYSYIEPRYTSAEMNYTDEIVNFGLQAFIRNYLVGQVVTQQKINQADLVCKAHGVPFNREGWEYILNVHEGRLPIVIEALPEGTVFPVGVPQVQVYNTDPKCFWLTSFLETVILRAVWYPSTVATLSREVKKIIKGYLEMTADNLDGLPFKLHDFGARGTTSEEQARIGGGAHLINFMGTDTLTSLIYLRENYGAGINSTGFSIPASEHSTITAWGGPDKEIDAFDNMLNQFAKPEALLACVSDSYDIYRACDELWGTHLKQKIIDSQATLVIRPDSGDPIDVTLDVIEILGKRFGYTLNTKGFKVLNNVRIIQGDGVNIHSIGNILENYRKNGWSADNIAFGMGAGLLQKVNRDSLGYAMKACAIKIGDEILPVYKKPVTDTKKVSKAGIQSVSNKFEPYTRNDFAQIEKYSGNLLKPVFTNGKFNIFSYFDEIRKKAEV